MSIVKIMPCLDMKNGRVVKGVHFVDIVDAGDPVANASFYQSEGADELAMLDIAATLENRGTRLEWVKSVSSVIDIPLTVGGGISSLEDIEMVLEAGADKVSMNSAAVADPELIQKASTRFGSDKITLAIDARRNSEMPSGFELVIRGGTKPIGKDAVAWAKTCESLGAGVILPTSMDGDGTQDGYDLEFTKVISDSVRLPGVASGGAGKLEHFYDGAVESYPYRTIETRLAPGDFVLLMSDGLPELFNERDEVLDYARVKETFRESAELTPDGIVNHLFAAADRWRNSRKQNDDMTFVVLRLKPRPRGRS